MLYYKTLKDEVIALEHLTKEERRLLEDMLGDYDSRPLWFEFNNQWLSNLKSFYKEKDGKALVRTSLFKIYQDMSSRLGVNQGKARLPDYRDKLRKIIEEKYNSRYEFCKEAGIDEAFLSAVLRKRKNFSIKNLEGILGKINYEIDIKKKMAM